MKRTLTLEATSLVGKKITLQGWVDTKRDHGKITFIDLRDRSGLVQCVGGKELKALHPEDVIEITGVTVKRSAETVNPELPTGTVEVTVETLTVLNTAKVLPFPIDTDGKEIDEEIRLRYRYVDLRRPRVHTNIKNRSKFVQASREYLFGHDFTEIETPMLTKSTKEGSRDFIVPSRLQPGKFFALPQSPQQYKQLLMAAGFERYFQIARCIRDEDLRADRGFEHSQIDMEMSFVSREEVMEMTEGMITHAIEKLGGKIATKPFEVITYQNAMKTYGADKFDPRTEEEKKKGLLSFTWVVDFPFFKKVDADDAAEVLDGKSGWTFTHNPFSQPKEEHLAWHLAGKQVDQILTTQYDLVCNGFEVGGGSIRAHQPEVLRATYKIMGYTDEEIEESVGHMLEAFSYGAPPHGGIAPGIERLIMILQHEEYLREVQAFPQTGRGSTAVMQAPTTIDDGQLKQLGIQVIKQQFDSVFDALIDLLTTHNVQYKLYEHEPVYTSEQAANIRGDVNLSQGAKAMMLEVKKEQRLFVLPGDQKMDLKQLRNLLGTSRVKLASFESVEKITGVRPGGVPPFGSLMGLSTMVDSRLATNEEIVFNAGRNDRSIKMRYKDFVKLENPEILIVE
jgi:aspartyl-tRNA synthetase